MTRIEGKKGGGVKKEKRTAWGGLPALQPGNQTIFKKKQHRGVTKQENQGKAGGRTQGGKSAGRMLHQSRLKEAKHRKKSGRVGAPKKGRPEGLLSEKKPKKKGTRKTSGRTLPPSNSSEI